MIYCAKMSRPRKHRSLPRKRTSEVAQEDLALPDQELRDKFRAELFVNELTDGKSRSKTLSEAQVGKLLKVLLEHESRWDISSTLQGLCAYKQTQGTPFPEKTNKERLSERLLSMADFIVALAVAAKESNVITHSADFGLGEVAIKGGEEDHFAVQKGAEMISKKESSSGLQESSIEPRNDGLIDLSGIGTIGEQNAQQAPMYPFRHLDDPVAATTAAASNFAEGQGKVPLDSAKRTQDSVTTESGVYTTQLFPYAPERPCCRCGASSLQPPLVRKAVVTATAAPSAMLGVRAHIAAQAMPMSTTVTTSGRTFLSSKLAQCAGASKSSNPVEVGPSGSSIGQSYLKGTQVDSQSLLTTSLTSADSAPIANSAVAYLPGTTYQPAPGWGYFNPYGYYGQFPFMFPGSGVDPNPFLFGSGNNAMSFSAGSGQNPYLFGSGHNAVGFCGDSGQNRFNVVSGSGVITTGSGVNTTGSGVIPRSGSKSPSGSGKVIPGKVQITSGQRKVGAPFWDGPLPRNSLVGKRGIGRPERTAMASGRSNNLNVQDILGRPCGRCKSMEHSTLFCGSVAPNERHYLARRYKLCFCCLQEDHQSVGCRLRKLPCPNCGQKGHHTLLCYRKATIEGAYIAQENRLMSEDSEDEFEEKLMTLVMGPGDETDQHFSTEPVYELETSDESPPSLLPVEFFTEGRRLTGFVDTGATVSLFPRKLAYEMNLPIRQMQCFLRTQKGDIDTTEAIDVEVKLGHRQELVTFLLIESCSGIFMGLPVIKALRLGIDCFMRVNQWNSETNELVNLPVPVLERTEEFNDDEECQEAFEAKKVLPSSRVNYGDINHVNATVLAVEEMTIEVRTFLPPQSEWVFSAQTEVSNNFIDRMSEVKALSKPHQIVADNQLAIAERKFPNFPENDGIFMEFAPMDSSSKHLVERVDKKLVDRPRCLRLENPKVKRTTLSKSEQKHEESISIKQQTNLTMSEVQEEEPKERYQVVRLIPCRFPRLITQFSGFVRMSFSLLLMFLCLTTIVQSTVKLMTPLLRSNDDNLSDDETFESNDTTFSNSGFSTGNQLFMMRESDHRKIAKNHQQRYDESVGDSVSA